MVRLFGGITFRPSDFRELLFDRLKECGANCLAVAMNAEAYIENRLSYQLPVPMKRVPYGDQMRNGTNWLRERGQKLLIYATYALGLRGFVDYGRVIVEPDLADRWIARWSQVISELQPDSLELIDECPSAELAANPALTFDAYWNWAIKCIDAYRAVKPDLNIMLTGYPFWDLHSMAEKPIPRANVTYAFALHYLGAAPKPYDWFMAYWEGRLDEAKALLEKYILDTAGVGAMLDKGLDLAFVFGSDYRTQPNWDAYLNDMYDFCRRHGIGSYFQFCYNTDTSDVGVYDGGVWNKEYTDFNEMGRLFCQNMPTPMPPIVPVIAGVGTYLLTKNVGYAAAAFIAAAVLTGRRG